MGKPGQAVLCISDMWVVLQGEGAMEQVLFVEVGFGSDQHVSERRSVSDG